MSPLHKEKYKIIKRYTEEGLYKGFLSSGLK